MATIDPIELTSYFKGDSNPETAGNGLAYAPFVTGTIDANFLQYWMMAPAEQLALIYLLDHLRPKTAIEIGTRYGGSLQVLSKFCGKVYSLDIDPDVPERLAGLFRNVEYIIGNSSATLPELLRTLGQRQNELSFVLVDGDHTTEGVRRDIDNLLQHTPNVPMAILMHDSFNPECRTGLRQASWIGSPYVHLVELDFVCGTVNASPAFHGQLWGGLALGLLLPQKRVHRFEVTARAEETYQAVLAADRPASTLGRTRRMLQRIFRAAF